MMDSEWEKTDWKRLTALRDRFLNRSNEQSDYWQTREDVELYDRTFAQRIAWKIESVLRELKTRQWAAPNAPIVDWGCGSGVAGRAFLDAFGRDNGTGSKLSLWDRSPLALRFAAERAKDRFPEAEVVVLKDAAEAEAAAEGAILVISHVANELSLSGLERFKILLSKAAAVIWIEPGTSPMGRLLPKFRDELADTFRAVAPCPHAAACGLRTEVNQAHWCHHFGEAPAVAFSDPGWVRFGQVLGVDLRSLPYSFLVLERKTAPVSTLTEPAALGRVIGRANELKGKMEVLWCSESGTGMRELQKRDSAKAWRWLHKIHESPLFLPSKDSGSRLESPQPWPEEG